MARYNCRWGNAFMVYRVWLALLILYVMVCMNFNTKTESTPEALPESNNDLFVANGRWINDSYAPTPTFFWKQHDDSFWNRLQLQIDRRFNPILHLENITRDFENITFHDTLLRDSFLDVLDTNSSRENFEELPETIQLFVNHMQKRDYSTIIQPKGVCGAGVENQKDPPLILMAIKTTMLNFRNRQVIRRTWGKEGWVAGHNGSGAYVRRVFLLGTEDTETLAQELLHLESDRYRDILQWDFMDTFFNLTLKDVLFWKWFSHHCNGSQFVFKGDDDVFVNTPKLITYLQGELINKSQTLNEFMVGDVIGSAIPLTDNGSKYFIPESFYKGLYPTYAGGGGVVYSGLLTKRLHRVSKGIHLFPIDDVYVGMCMLHLNAYPIHNPAFLTFGFSGKEEQEPCAYHKILLVHKRNPEQTVELWKDLKRTMRECWDVPFRVGSKMKTIDPTIEPDTKDGRPQSPKKRKNRKKVMGVTENEHMRKKNHPVHQVLHTSLYKYLSKSFKPLRV